MNKQFVKKGTTLNKNMTNMESLNLTRLNCNYIKTNALTCSTLDIPTAIPTDKDTLYAGTMYFDTTSHDLYIYDGTDWNYITLHVV